MALASLNGERLSHVVYYPYVHQVRSQMWRKDKLQHVALKFSSVILQASICSCGLQDSHSMLIITCVSKIAFVNLRQEHVVKVAPLGHACQRWVVMTSLSNRGQFHCGCSHRWYLFHNFHLSCSFVAVVRRSMRCPQHVFSQPQQQGANGVSGSSERRGHSSLSNVPTFNSARSFRDSSLANNRGPTGSINSADILSSGRISSCSDISRVNGNSICTKPALQVQQWSSSGLGGSRNHCSQRHWL